MEEANEEEEEEAWAKSASKAILRAGLLSGEITDAMKPKQVWNLHPTEHGKWNYNNWSSNLRTLRNAVQRDRTRMQKDCIAYGHDLAIVRSLRDNSKTPWHRSAAAPLLKQDVKDGKHKEQKPKDLHKSRPEYEEFDLPAFRKHIYQEKDAEPKRAVRFERKKKRWQYPELHEDHPRLNSDT